MGWRTITVTWYSAQLVVSLTISISGRLNPQHSARGAGQLGYGHSVAGSAEGQSSGWHNSVDGYVQQYCCDNDKVVVVTMQV